MIYLKLFALHYYRRNFLILPLKISSNKYSTNAPSHYDVLGVTPKATQADVKAAYYNQSKIYHPDRSGDSAGAAHKFRAISEAYEVLGNIKLRRLYDKGFLHLSSNSREYADDPSINFYRSRRNRPAPPTGKTQIYDFDEWAKSHYGATFARDMKLKEKMRAEKQHFDHDAIQKKNEHAVIGVVGGIMFIMYLFSEPNNKNDTILEPLDK